jgi:hypothetical protein
VFEDAPHSKEDYASSSTFLWSKKEFWSGFSAFLKEFNNDIFERGVIDKFPEIVNIIVNSSLM